MAIDAVMAGSIKVTPNGEEGDRRPANLDVVRRLMDEVWNGGNLALLPQLIADSYVGHLPIGDHYGPGGLRIDIEAYRRAIPDLTVTLLHLLADDDLVVRHFALTGVLTSGTPVFLDGIAIDRLEAGRLVESWAVIDRLPE
jgi:hypothetical protein